MGGAKFKPQSVGYRVKLGISAARAERGGISVNLKKLCLLVPRPPGLSLSEGTQTTSTVWRLHGQVTARCCGKFPTCPRNVAAVVVFSRAMDWKNKLYFGDNLNILRERVSDASIDLIYLDPPFNSNANYNVLFKEKSGEESAARITTFEDTWQWRLEAEAVYKEIVTSGHAKPDRSQLWWSRVSRVEFRPLCR